MGKRIGTESEKLGGEREISVDLSGPCVAEQVSSAAAAGEERVELGETFAFRDLSAGLPGTRLHATVLLYSPNRLTLIPTHTDLYPPVQLRALSLSDLLST